MEPVTGSSEQRLNEHWGPIKCLEFREWLNPLLTSQGGLISKVLISSSSTYTTFATTVLSDDDDDDV
jgi:hypothetical protein